jgi:hypothetical protein
MVEMPADTKTRLQFLGEDGMDTDLPSRLELLVLKTVLGKAFFWCVC